MRHSTLILLTLFLVAGCQGRQPKSKARTEPDKEPKTNPEQKAIAYIEQLGGQVGKRKLRPLLAGSRGPTQPRRGKRLRSSPGTVEKEIVVWVKLSGTKERKRDIPYCATWHLRRKPLYRTLQTIY
jgi:hypothetical protein